MLALGYRIAIFDSITGITPSIIIRAMRNHIPPSSCLQARSLLRPQSHMNKLLPQLLLEDHTLPWPYNVLTLCHT